MWPELEIETRLERTLRDEFGSADGQTHFGKYIAARAKLEEIWEIIKRREPNLTDHGTRHIEDVIRQAQQITPANHLCARELLALLLSILYHDTGNIYGREGHEKHISDIFDFVVGSPIPSDRLQEKKLILAVVGAHGGEARDGSKDTIRDLNQAEPFLRKPVRVREIASILRFADELAEGPHRTSEYLRRTHGFDITADKYHDYAAITEVCLDPGNDRIALTYHIDVADQNGSIAPDELSQVKQLLEFAYHRIRKLDEERQYARYYSSALGAYKRTSATFNIWYRGQQLDLGLSPLELTDLVIPEGRTRSVADVNPAYHLDAVITRLAAGCSQVRAAGTGGPQL